MIFKQKEKILKNMDNFLSKVNVKTENGWFALYLVDKDWYARHLNSVDKRLGLVYGTPELGQEISYFNPRVEKKSFIGRIDIIKS